MNSKRIISASAVILDQDENILLIEGKRRGWELPGGRIKNNEKIIDALIREVREETGVEIHNINYCGLFHNIDEDTINLLFIAEYSSGKPSINKKECSNVEFVSFEEASKRVKWSNFLKRIESVLYENSPFIVEF
jgi:ADP-ribose pyrophosphatase YjhB (NUDIX family)